MVASEFARNEAVGSRRSVVLGVLLVIVVAGLLVFASESLDNASTRPLTISGTIARRDWTLRAELGDEGLVHYVFKRGLNSSSSGSGDPRGLSGYTQQDNFDATLIALGIAPSGTSAVKVTSAGGTTRTIGVITPGPPFTNVFYVGRTGSTNDVVRVVALATDGTVIAKTSSRR